MKNTFIAAFMLALLAACQSTKLEDDTRYVRMATIVDRHEFSEIERQQAQANRPSNTRVGIGFGVGTGSGGSFSAMSLGIGHRVGEQRDQPPHIADGAIRYTVQPQGTTERIEVMSLEKLNEGDCVKVLAYHPRLYPRFFALKPGERCD